MKATAEAVIVGGGVMGCSILYSLASRRMTDTLLLESEVLGSGSTGRSQAILRMHYSNEVTTRMAWESLGVFKEFEQEVGSPSGYVRTGYVLIVDDDDRAALEENVAMQRSIGVATEPVSRTDLAEIAPTLDVADGEACAYEPESGYADPYSVTQGYARRAQDMGARIRMRTPATEIEVTGGRVTGVVTPVGRVSTHVAVVAAAPWSDVLLRRLGVTAPLQAVRHQIITLRRREDLVPDHPVVGDVVNSLSARPDVGNLTLVGVGEDEQVPVEGYDHGVDMAAVQDVSAKLATRMPGMSHAVFRGGWSGLFTTTPDWHPILDRVEGVEGYTAR